MELIPINLSIGYIDLYICCILWFIVYTNVSLNSKSLIHISTDSKKVLFISSFIKREVIMAAHVIHFKCGFLALTVKTREVATIEIPVIQCTSLQDFFLALIYDCYKQFKSM